MRDLYWARSELAILDPVRDARRYAQIAFETRYGAPMFIHALFSAAFAYNMGDPRIAEVLYRNGTGTIVTHTRRRNFETLVFFGMIYKHGDGPEGQRVIQRINEMHRPYPITNDLYLYTLSTLAVLPRRISERFAGKRGISSADLEAQFQLWCRMGALMGITGIPASQDAFLAWMLDYEQKTFRHTPASEAIFRALAQEWAEYWFPPPARKWAEGLFGALIAPEVRTALGVPPPSRAQTLTVQWLVRSFMAWVRVMPDPRERGLAESFGARLRLLPAG